MTMSGCDIQLATTAHGAIVAMAKHDVRVLVANPELPDRDGIWLLNKTNRDPALAKVRSTFYGLPPHRNAAKRAFDAGLVA